MRATGLLRSQTSTSSPCRTSWICALSRALRSLIFTVRIESIIPNLTMLVMSYFGRNVGLSLMINEGLWFFSAWLAFLAFLTALVVNLVNGDPVPSCLVAGQLLPLTSSSSYNLNFHDSRPAG